MRQPNTETSILAGAVLALSSACAAQTPEIKIAPTTTMAINTKSIKIAQRVFDAWMAVPNPVLCDTLDPAIDDIVKETGWGSYSREPSISEGPWREKKYVLSNGVTLIIRRDPTDFSNLTMMQASACDTETCNYGETGAYVGRLCLRDYDQ